LRPLALSSVEKSVTVQTKTEKRRICKAYMVSRHSMYTGQLTLYDKDHTLPLCESDVSLVIVGFICQVVMSSLKKKEFWAFEFG